MFLYKQSVVAKFLKRWHRRGMRWHWYKTWHRLPIHRSCHWVMLVIFAVGVIMGGVFRPWAFKVGASSSSVSETFSATTNRDGTNTTGQWTGNGTARGTVSRSWSEISTGMESSDIVGLAGSSETFYAVANAGGVFKTTNAGTSWTKLSGLPDRGAGSLAGFNSSIVAVGLADGRLVKTTNGGTSWTTTTVTASGQLINTVRTIAFSPNYNEAGTDKAIFVGGWATGIYKSTDGGTNWSLASTGLPANSTIDEIRLVPTYHEADGTVGNGRKTLFTTLTASGAGAIYKSTDGGSNWTDVTPSGFAGGRIDGLAIEQTCDALAACRVAAGNDAGKVAVSHNAGTAWSAAVQVATGNNLVQALAYTPDTTDTVLFAATAGGDGLFRSADHGTTWTNINAGGSVVTAMNGQVSVNAFAFNTDNGNTVLAGTAGGGVFKSTNTNTGVVAWAEANGGLIAPFTYDLARVNDSDSDDTNDVLYAGTAAGLYKTTNGGTSWTRQAYSDYGASWQRSVLGVEVDPDDATNILIAVKNHGIYRSTNSGTSFSRVYPAAAVLDAGGGEMKLAFAPNNSTIFGIIDGTASGGRVVRSTDNGATWTGVDTSTINVNTLEHLAISSTYGTDSTLFVITNSGGLFRSTDNGATWSAVTVTVSSTTYTNFVSIALSPSYNQAVANDCSDAATCTLYLGTASGLVLRSINKGSTWSQVYSNSGGNTIDALAVSPASQDTTVIVGPQSGPLAAADDGATFATSAIYMSGLTDSTGYSDGYQTVSAKDFLLHPSYFTNQSLWMATNAGIFKMIPSYSASSVIQTVDLVSASTPTTAIRAATVTPTASTPTNTSITYQLATTSGLSFETFTALTARSFTTTGTALYFKATLATTDATITPALNTVAISYTLNAVPATPTNSTPTASAQNTSLTPALTASAFSDSDSDTHNASQWQVTTTSGNYNSPTYNSGTDTSNLVSLTLPNATLVNCTTYYWRVRYRDNLGDWSAYSSETSFKTTNCGSAATAAAAVAAATSAATSGEASSTGGSGTGAATGGLTVHNPAADNQPVAGTSNNQISDKPIPDTLNPDTPISYTGPLSDTAIQISVSDNTPANAREYRLYRGRQIYHGRLRVYPASRQDAGQTVVIFLDNLTPNTRYDDFFLTKVTSAGIESEPLPLPAVITWASLPPHVQIQPIATARGELRGVSVDFSSTNSPLTEYQVTAVSGDTTYYLNTTGRLRRESVWFTLAAWPRQTIFFLPPRQAGRYTLSLKARNRDLIETASVSAGVVNIESSPAFPKPVSRIDLPWPSSFFERARLMQATNEVVLSLTPTGDDSSLVINGEQVAVPSRQEGDEADAPAPPPPAPAPVPEPEAPPARAPVVEEPTPVVPPPPPAPKPVAQPKPPTPPPAPVAPPAASSLLRAEALQELANTVDLSTSFIQPQIVSFSTGQARRITPDGGKTWYSISMRFIDAETVEVTIE